MITFLDQLLRTWVERGPTSIYRVFLLWLAIVNWRFLYILLFEDSSKITGLRTDFALQQHLFKTNNIYGEIFVNFAFYILPAYIATIVTIWYLPHIKHLAYKISLDFLYAQKKMRLDHDTAVAEYKASQTETQAKAVVLQKKAEDTIKKNTSDEEKWENEAEQLRYYPNDLMAITIARSAIYRHSGLFSSNPQFAMDREYIMPDILARIDSLGVADIDQRTSRLTATKKGKFLFRFLEKNNLLQPRG